MTPKGCFSAFSENIKRTIEELNKDYVGKVLELYGGNKSRAAEVLGISRTSLWRILKEE